MTLLYCFVTTIIFTFCGLILCVAVSGLNRANRYDKKAKGKDDGLVHDVGYERRLRKKLFQSSNGEKNFIGKFTG